ncbi:MAG: HD-GYP domain-containing protein [Chloroflexi bacterium]|nr:HD-GYP domain-containing protein [Chloroflexota bacterium]
MCATEVLSTGTAQTRLDSFTRRHCQEVAGYVGAIADAMGLPAEIAVQIRWAGLLHDIGKAGIDDRILSKPGPLNDAEWLAVKAHPAIGYSMLGPWGLSQPITESVYHHHERYDGRGYPTGLKGEMIPLWARVVAVADAFSAMRSHRTYQKPLPISEALAELRRCAGIQFDPQVVSAFFKAIMGEVAP